MTDTSIYSLRRVLPKCPTKPSPWPPSSSSSAPSSSPSARCSWPDTLESPSTRIELCLSSSLGSWSSCLAFTTCASLTMHPRVTPDTPMTTFPTLMTETLHTRSLDPARGAASSEMLKCDRSG